MGGAARAILLAVVLACAAPALARPKIVVGQPAPPFTLHLPSGEDVTSESLRGKVIVLNYWATWCAPCRKELPLLEGYYQIMRPNGLRMFAIPTEDSVPMSKMRKLMDALTIPFVSRMRGDYGAMEGVPTNYIIDRAGVVRYAKAAAFDLDDLNELLVPLLNEPAPPAL